MSLSAHTLRTDGLPLTVNDRDLIYGGWDSDTLQADMGDAGTVEGDRLIDWSGSFNLFAVCDYGAGQVVREFSPEAALNLQALATADGSTSVQPQGATGTDELGLVNSAQVKRNTKPKHKDWPGNFTCEA